MTLGAEGMLLHSAIHLSKHLFSHGLKTAWDFVWLLDRFPQMDWNRLEMWVKKTGMRRGFWVPVRVLASELSIAFPAEFLAKRQRTNGRKTGNHHRKPFVWHQQICNGRQSLGLPGIVWRTVWRLWFFGKYSRELRRERKQKSQTLKTTNSPPGLSRWRKLRVALAKWRQLS